MRKLRLDFEQLTVESFDVTSDALRERGTVRGRISFPALTCDATECYQNTCDTCQSCPASCWQTCGDTCGGSCGGTCGATCDVCATNEETCFSCGGSCPPYCTWNKAPC
jgi:hypothetical protein